MIDKEFWVNFNDTQMLDLMPDGVIVMDSNTTIRYINKAMRRLLEIPPEEKSRKTKCKELLNCSRKHEQCTFFKSMESGEAVSNYEMSITTSKGRELIVSISSSILYSKDNKIMGIIEIFRDVTLIKEIISPVISDFNYPEIIGNSKKMREVFSVVTAVARSKSTVLIEGESGTGKELIARGIHTNSPRRAGVFLALNCAAMTEGLLESEMFGHQRGSFTGAYHDKPGKFEQAHKGTLFLDEIADMSLSTQAKLLRVIQEETFERVGGSKTISVDVRIIAATNKDLMNEMKQGRFRDDLYYRIRVFPIKLPPLRDRPEDIPLLIRHFIKNFNQEMNKNIDNVSPKAMDVLLSYDYPGNIRELENIIEYSFICCNDNTILIEHLPKELVSDSKELVDQVVVEGGTIQILEKEMIIRLLNQSSRNYNEISGKLGISRTTLWRKMKQYNIKV